MSQGHNINAKLRDAGARGYPTFCYDSVGNITFASGADIPTGAGYAYGCLFVQNDATTPGAGVYINVGSSSSASFVPQASVSAMMSFAVPFSAISGNMVLGENHLWIAPVAMTLQSIKEIHSVKSTVASTASIYKAASTTAFSGGTILHSGSIDFTTNINTVSSLTLTVTALLAGDRIGAIVSTSTPTTLAGGVIVITGYPT